MSTREHSPIARDAALAKMLVEAVDTCARCGFCKVSCPTYPFGGGFETIDGCAMLLCSGDSEEPERVREAVLSRAEALLREGIGADYFLRMKRSALGRRIKGLDSFDGTCFRLCAYHFAGFDYFRFPAIYQDITPEEVLAFLARVVKPDRCALSVIDSVAEPAI